MTREELVNKACSYIKPTPYPNPNDITRWFWGNNLQHAWCGAFIDYVVKHDLGCDWLDSCTKEKYIGGFGFVPSIVQWAKDNGYWCNDYAKAQTGDLVVFDWTPETKGGMEHVGIVKSLSGDNLICVEGNTSNGNYKENCVAQKTRNKKYITGIVQLPYKESGEVFNIGDYVYAKEDINLYTTTEYRESKYTLKKGEKAYVRYKQGNSVALADPETHEYFPSAWTNQLDKLTKEDPSVDYKELYEKELLINKDLKAQIDQLQEKINKAMEDLK